MQSKSDFYIPPNCLKGMKSFSSNQDVQGQKSHSPGLEANFNKMFMIGHYEKYQDNQSMRQLYSKCHQWNTIKKNRLTLEWVINERNQVKEIK